MVTAAINISAMTLVGYDALDQPIVEASDFGTVVTLQDDQTIHVGTVESKQSVKYRRGIPGLRDLPGLKYLFSVEGSRTVESEMYIIVTPHYSNTMVYSARMKGDPGTILKIVPGTDLPEFVQRNVLPIKND